MVPIFFKSIWDSKYSKSPAVLWIVGFPDPLLERLNFFCESRYKLFQVSNDKHISGLTYWRILVGVDGNNEFRFFHSCQVLDCA